MKFNKFHINNFILTRFTVLSAVYVLLLQVDHVLATFFFRCCSHLFHLLALNVELPYSTALNYAARRTTFVFTFTIQWTFNNFFSTFNLIISSYIASSSFEPVIIIDVLTEPCHFSPLLSLARSILKCFFIIPRCHIHFMFNFHAWLAFHKLTCRK